MRSRHPELCKSEELSRRKAKCGIKFEKYKGKGKGHPITGHDLYSFFNIGARWRGRVNATHRSLYHRGMPGTYLREAGWTPGPVRTGAENLAPTGIRFPDGPAGRYTDWVILAHKFAQFKAIIAVQGNSRRTYGAQPAWTWFHTS